MCIVIDTNALSRVFKKGNSDHIYFKPVHDWIITGNGKIVIGGSKYKNETLEKISWFLPFLNLLNQCGKVVMIADAEVDKKEKTIIEKSLHRDFDDPHIIALLSVSKCKLVCTTDKRAFPFIQNKSLYSKGHQIPAIYQTPRNMNLLCNKYISNCCKPNQKSRKQEIEIMIAAAEKIE